MAFPNRNQLSHPTEVRLPQDGATRERWLQLQSKILTHGGDRVVWQGSEPDLDALLEYGDLFDHPIKRVRGERHRCHQNAAKRWAKDVEGNTIVTGYALSTDGLWRQHSCVIRNRTICETTVVREKYFGIALDDASALKFCFDTFFVLMNDPELATLEWGKKYPAFGALVARVRRSFRSQRLVGDEDVLTTRDVCGTTASGAGDQLVRVVR